MCVLILAFIPCCLRRNVRGVGPAGQAGRVRVQCSAPESGSVEHLHGEVSSRDLQTMSQPHNDSASI